MVTYHSPRSDAVKAQSLTALVMPLSHDAGHYIPRAMSPAKHGGSTTPQGSPTSVFASFTPTYTPNFTLVSTTPTFAPPSIRPQRSSSRKLRFLRTSTPSRTPLGERSDSGNSSPLTFEDMADMPLKFSPEEVSDDNSSNTSSGSGSSPSEEEDQPFDFSKPLASPMKRSEGILNLEQVSNGSPATKRKSLHGEFTIYDSESRSDPSQGTPRRINYARKSSSLRRSTMKQRHGERVQLFGLEEQQAKSRPRLSLDSYPGLNSGMAHEQDDQEHERGSLSRTISNTSSSSSLMDDSPTHIPIKISAFSKSLPAGAPRPALKDLLSRRPQPNLPNATPWKAAAKPEPKAFMSTGLISKRNRRPSVQDGPAMPDTPCKRVFGFFHPTTADEPAEEPPKSIFRTSVFSKKPEHEFGSPTVVRRNANLFGLAKSVRNELGVRPMAQRSISQSSSDFELPATPTKFSIRRPRKAAGIPVFAPDNGPQTPMESQVPDPSSLSISCEERQTLFPATPIGKAAAWASTPAGPKVVADIDSTILSRFTSVDLIGKGEFSTVYRGVQRSLGQADKVFAIKKSSKPYTGQKDRQNKLREVEFLRALSAAEHVVDISDSWEAHNHLFIQLEYCEEGSLRGFLDNAGFNARLDDFRIWKILLELTESLKSVHDAGYIHLDLKPANVLVTFEGVLKVCDFGMATTWPAPSYVEAEGDREYIGPEILRGVVDKPADIFSLGLIMVEIAGNVVLPDNGSTWQRLRAGDLSDVPSLTWTTDSSLARDQTGNPVPDGEAFAELDSSDHRAESVRRGELQHPPAFMGNIDHEQTLDKIVRQMISPDPADRPTADQLLATEGLRWVASRRRAGATIFEGPWGPADAMVKPTTEIEAFDTEMLDV